MRRNKTAAIVAILVALGLIGLDDRPSLGST